MSATPRLSLPFLSAGQAQKEFTVNEALQTIDLALFASAEEGPLNDPPASPALGSCYIVGAEPTGEWSGRSQALAGYTSGGWRFITPTEGAIVYIKAEAQCACYRSEAWEFGVLRGSSLMIGGIQVVGQQGASIASASGGTTVDSEARTAIDQILAAMREHGLIAS